MCVSMVVSMEICWHAPQGEKDFKTTDLQSSDHFAG